jgi:ribonuclease P protein component
LTEKPASKFTFNKSARLSSKKDIKELFDKGSSFFLHPFKVLYLEDTLDRIQSNQILITVPKRNHKTAVKRNKIKRLIRESYRLNQFILSEATDKKFFIAYIYISEDLPTFKEVESKLKKVLLRLKSITLGKERRPYKNGSK